MLHPTRSSSTPCGRKPRVSRTADPGGSLRGVLLRFLCTLLLLHPLPGLAEQAAPPNSSPPLAQETWDEVFHQLEMDFADLVRDWRVLAAKRAATPEPEAPVDEETLLLELQAATSELLVRENQLTGVETPLRELQHERDLLKELQGVELSADEQLEQTLAQAHAESMRTREAFLQAGRDLGLGNLLARRIEGWWELRERARSQEALEKGTNMQAILRIEADFDESFLALGTPIYVAWRELRLAVADEYEAAQALYRHQHEQAAAPGHLASIEAEIAALEPALARARAAYDEARRRVEVIERELAALRAPHRAGDDARSAFLATLDRLTLVYGVLIDEFDAYPFRLSSQTWCRAHVHGGLAALLAGDHRSTARLRTAAAARDGVCLGTIAPYLDTPLFQAAWAKALFLEQEDARVEVSLYMGADHWTIDGVPVYGRGTNTVTLRSGLHRFEATTPAGELRYLVEEIRPYPQGEKTGLWADHRGVQVAALPPGLNEWSVPTPVDFVAPADRERVAQTAAPGAAPSGRAHLDSSLCWLRFDERDHWGGSLALSWTVLRRAAWEWHVGASHDQLWGDAVYRYSPTRASSVLYRERLLTRALFLRQSRVQPGLALSAGVVPPLNAAVADAELLVRWRFTPRFSLLAAGGVAGSWWDLPSVAFWQGETTGAEPRVDLGLEVEL